MGFDMGAGLRPFRAGLVRKGLGWGVYVSLILGFSQISVSHAASVTSSPKEVTRDCGLFMAMARGVWNFFQQPAFGGANVSSLTKVVRRAYSRPAQELAELERLDDEIPEARGDRQRLRALLTARIALLTHIERVLPSRDIDYKHELIVLLPRHSAHYEGIVRNARLIDEMELAAL